MSNDPYQSVDAPPAYDDEDVMISGFDDKCIRRAFIRKVTHFRWLKMSQLHNNQVSSQNIKGQKSSFYLVFFPLKFLYESFFFFFFCQAVQP